MFFDPLYMLIILVTMVLSGVASSLVKARFARGEKTPLSRNLSGAQVAARVLQAASVEGVRIVETGGFLSDHYNPVTRTLSLSRNVYNGRNAAAAGVAAHEAGHAIQHAQKYFPLWFRSAVVPAANLGSRLGPWIVIAGILLGSVRGSSLGYSVALFGILLFGIATLFTLITLPVEYNASARARKMLAETGIVSPGREADAAAGVLSAAGLTYVAAAANSLLMLLYWASRAGLLGRRRD